jgi:hypothetical protein
MTPGLCRDVFRHAEARRADVRRHAEPHVQESFGLAIIGAEYVLGWLPKGTHQWEKFITPAELKSGSREQRDGEGRKRRHLQSLLPRLAVSRDMDVNYMLLGEKGSCGPSRARMTGGRRSSRRCRHCDGKRARPGPASSP